MRWPPAQWFIKSPRFTSEMTTMKSAMWGSLFILLIAGSGAFAQTTGVIKGVVILEERNLALHHAAVLISQLGRSLETNEDGTFEFRNVPPGVYDVLATSAGLANQLQTVEVAAGATVTLDFKLSLSPVRQEITVTATGVEQVAFESFQTVSTLDSFDLAEKTASSVGDVLDNQPGVAKRSSGPGTSRPVIRGFDGDRVLIMQDGVRTGTLSSQSGDHGEPIDVMSIERLEVVKGPATLLYGSNAIGGVVNAVSRHFQMKEQTQEGIHGYVTGTAGSNNRNGAGSAGFEYGLHDWLLWMNGGNQKTQDYKTGGGAVVLNSGTRLTSGSGGLGWFGNRGFASAGYTYDDGIYGIPLEKENTDEVTRLDFIRRDARLSGGARNVAVFDGVRFTLNFSNWMHKELNFAEPGPPVLGTLFNNNQYTYQMSIDKKHRDKLSGTFGFYGMHRDYRTEGEEAIAPPVKGHVAAAFGLEEIEFDVFKLQFGGRIESTRYTPSGAPKANFIGLSGAIGIHVPVWQGGAFVSNFTHSYRAPALEELYNNGPHPGNLSFEIGDPNLKRERSDGLDISLRHMGDRLHAETNLYLYRLTDFVYLAPTGAEHEGLREAIYSQGNTRYMGTEMNFDVEAHPNLWINTGLDYVNAELTATDTPIPRIPPLRVRLGLDARYKGLSVKPEVVMADRQSRVFSTETDTAGYTVLNLNASYTIPSQHFSHHIAFNAFNLGDRLYRNHLSFIKDIAPEIGRGLRVTYSMKFF